MCYEYVFICMLSALRNVCDNRLVGWAMMTQSPKSARPGPAWWAKKVFPCACTHAASRRCGGGNLGLVSRWIQSRFHSECSVGHACECVANGVAASDSKDAYPRAHKHATCLTRLGYTARWVLWSSWKTGYVQLCREAHHPHRVTKDTRGGHSPLY